MNLTSLALNTSKAGFSYLISIIRKRAVIMGIAPAVSFELTNYCNLSCPECHTGSGNMKRKKGFMELDLFDKILKELHPFTYHLNLYFQGEPMLHPYFFGFLEKSKRFKTTLSTNGHFIDNVTAQKLAVSGLNKLIVSLDGMTEETYCAYRVNGDFLKVIEGIKLVSFNIKKYSSPLKLVVQFLVNRQNEHQIPLLKKFAKEVNARLELKSMQVITENGFEKWMPYKKKYRRYTEINGGYKIKNKLPKKCARLWFSPVITWDGYLIPCCFDKEAEYKMGNLKDQSFKEIWESPQFMLFRNNLLKDRYSINICSNCSSGVRGIRN